MIRITLVLLLSEKLYEYKIKYVKYPIMDSDLNVPYGVFKDESRWNNKA